jgi:hypothetical protein
MDCYENRMYKQLLLDFRFVLQDDSILTRLQPLPSEYFPVNHSTNHSISDAILD